MATKTINKNRVHEMIRITVEEKIGVRISLHESHFTQHSIQWQQNEQSNDGFKHWGSFSKTIL